MGFQIPGPTSGKVGYLMATHGAELLPEPPATFGDVPEDKALICVVDTINYETAHYCFSGLEFGIYNDSADFRKRAWLLMDRRKAEELSQFPRSQSGGG